MSEPSPMDDDAVRWFTDYADKSLRAFDAQFAAQRGRFCDGDALLSRFRDAVARVESGGWDWGAVPHVDEIHNEMCIADAILSSKGERLRCRILQYEPAIPGAAQTIDFRVRTEDSCTVYVDVKTVKPLARDRWGQYEQAIDQGWIPENIKVDLFRDGNGGEIWHGWFAARSRMLEYSLEMEAKIAEGGLEGDETFFVLALCGSGREWGEDRLQDFVHFYRAGIHRDDDAFSRMELDYTRKRAITLVRTISSFAYLARPQGQIRPKCLNWNVQSPPQPWLAL